MASPRQPKPGLEIARKHQAKLGGVNLAVVVIGRFGSSNPESTIHCFDPDKLYAHFGPSITIDARTLNFSAARPPQPQVVAGWILEADDAYGTLEQLERWLCSAPAKALVALRDRLASPTES